MATRLSNWFIRGVPIPDPRRWHRIVPVLLLVAIPACSRDHTYLPALLANPMASYQADGIELIDSSEQGEGTDIVLAMPTNAEVVRRYRIEDQSRTAEVLSDAVAFSESVGWRMQRESDSAYLGALDLDVGPGRIHLSTTAEEVLTDPDGPRVLRIYMDFGSVRFDSPTIPTEGK